ncbi:MAG: hypothetical protein WA390_05235, partial [Nitrososphaeraceae archaeon]
YITVYIIPVAVYITVYIIPVAVYITVYIIPVAVYINTNLIFVSVSYLSLVTITYFMACQIIPINIVKDVICHAPEIPFATNTE